MQGITTRAAAFLVFFAAPAGAGGVTADLGCGANDGASGEIRRWQLASLKPKAMHLGQGGCHRVHPEFGIIFFIGDCQALIRSETHEGGEPLWTIDHLRVSVNQGHNGVRIPERLLQETDIVLIEHLSCIDLLFH